MRMGRPCDACAMPISIYPAVFDTAINHCKVDSGSSVAMAGTILEEISEIAV